MGGNFNRIQREIEELTGRIAAGDIGTARPWGGAGVCIRRNPLPERSGDFYPDPRVVVTPFVSELSWLFERLWQAFRPTLDHATKFEFFGRLENAATRYHDQSGTGATVEGLLSAVIDKANIIAGELVAGNFQALMIAPGRAIAEDFTQMDDRPT